MDEIAKAAPLPELELEMAEPIDHGGKTYSSVVLREPKAREVQQALAMLGTSATPDSMFKYNTTLMAAVSGLPRQVVEQLPIRQFSEGARYLESFLEVGP
jgi:hypothetical protein